MNHHRKTYTTRVNSLNGLDRYLSSKSNLNHYSFVAYIWHEYGFFPIYFNELFNEFFDDSKDDLIIATCFQGHEFFYEGKVDELIILESFIDTQRAYQNSKRTELFKEKCDYHADQSIAFWFTIRNFDEDEYQKIIDKCKFKRELFSIGKKKTWFYHLHPGPRESRPYQYARGEKNKKYFLPENVTPWQTDKRLGWNIDYWQAFHDHPRTIDGDYYAIFVKNSFKTLDKEGRKRFGYIDDNFLQYILDYFIKRKRKLVIIHDLIEHRIPTNEYLQEIRMTNFLDIKLYLSIVHHSEFFISSATSPIDLAAYYCDTNLILLDDKGKKINWIEKISSIRKKNCYVSNSRTMDEAKRVVQYIDQFL